MGTIVSFFTVLSVIIIAVCFTAGIGIMTFLDTYLIPVSIAFWGCILLFSYCLSRKEKDPHEKSLYLSAPFCLLPVYFFVVSALPEILAMKGFFEPFLAVCIELPLCVCVTLLVGIGIGWAGNRFQTPIIAVSLTAVGNILFALWVTSLGI